MAKKKKFQDVLELIPRIKKLDLKKKDFEAFSDFVNSENPFTWVNENLKSMDQSLRFKNLMDIYPAHPDLTPQIKQAINSRIIDFKSGVKVY